MISNYYAKLVGKRNDSAFLGLPMGCWLVIDHKSGGGFAGLPQELWLRQLDPFGKEASLYPEFGEFPSLSTGVVFHMGGRWQGLSYQAINGCIQEFLKERRNLSNK